MTTAHLAHLVGGDDSHAAPLVRFLEAAGFQVAHHASADQFLQTDTEAAPRGLVLELHMQSMNAPQLRSLLGERQTGMPLIVINEDGTEGTEMLGGSAGMMAATGIGGSQQAMVRAQLIAAFRGALMPFDESGPQQQQRQQHHARLKTLTRREREVLEGLVKGRLNKQIAAELGTSERTVKAHRQQVMRKMQAASLAALVAAMTRY
ncbi:response regulator transcription factor [Herbaspirillum sp. NPDC087042]|uniref:response regulator transcription factor n=1 Tax=Herbaspirillum sp. NPDC087042 TaxID=3364004 RepID=UPI0038194278